MAYEPLTVDLVRLADEHGSLDAPASRAELLVAAAHRYRDREVWGGDRALTYWDRLPDRVRTATYAGPRLPQWWERICRELGVGQPSRREDREAVSRALAAGGDAAVLAALRGETEALCLRVRLAVELARQASDPEPAPEPDPEPDRQEAMDL